MMRIITALVFAFSVSGAFAAGGASVPLDHIKTDIRDQESMQRGLALFTNYCFGCHALGYSRYERAANDLGIPNEIFEENLMDGDEWTFLQGSESGVREFANVLAVKYKQISPIDFSHSNIISVFNPGGELVHQQEGLGVDNKETINTIIATAKN